jgi:hypothetical protein
LFRNYYFPAKIDVKYYVDESATHSHIVVVSIVTTGKISSWCSDSAFAYKEARNPALLASAIPDEASRSPCAPVHNIPFDFDSACKD